MKRFSNLHLKLHLWLSVIAISFYFSNDINAEVNRVTIRPTWGEFSRPLNRITFVDFWFSNGGPTKNLTDKADVHTVTKMLDDLQYIRTLEYNVMDGAVKAVADTTATIEWVALSEPKAQIVISDTEKDPELIWITDSTVQRYNNEYRLTPELRDYITDKSDLIYLRKPGEESRTQVVNHHIGNIHGINFESNDTVVVLRSIVGVNVFWAVGAKRYDFISYCLQARNPYQILDDKVDVDKFLTAIDNAKLITELPYDAESPATRAMFFGRGALVAFMPKDSFVGIALIYTKSQPSPEIIWFPPARIQRGNRLFEMPDEIHNLLLDTGLHHLHEE